MSDGKKPQENAKRDISGLEAWREALRADPQAAARRKQQGIESAGISDKQKAYVTKTIPSQHQNLFVQAFSGNSKAAAIKAKCLACCNLDREEITHCTVQICPLWPVRPYQQGEE
jgi:hypothetical protein